MKIFNKYERYYYYYYYYYQIYQLGTGRRTQKAQANVRPYIAYIGDLDYNYVY